MLMVAIFIVDVVVPSGVAIGVMYVLVVLLLVKQEPWMILLAAGTSIGLTLLVLLFSYVDATQWTSFVNRGISVASIATAAFVAVRYDFHTSLKGDRLHLEASHLMLEEKNKQLEQYMYIASHHLNEPLQTISSFVNIIEEEEKENMSEELSTYFSFINEASIQLREMVLGLLNFSRTGRDQPFKKVDLEKEIFLVQQNLDRRIRKVNASLHVEPLPRVVGMATELRQIFRELIFNALKFQAPGNRPEIHVTSSEDEFEWTFCVADNGIGIREDLQLKVFEMFTRLHRPEEYPGQGIGLALCEKIIDLHLGKIWVESEQGKGSRFYFTIMKPPA